VTTLEKVQAWQTIHAERAWLADLLATLTEAERERGSLCAGWTVRDVAAHIISSPQTGLGAVAGAMVRSRGNFNRAMFLEAKQWSARATDAIVADYRRLDGSRRHPPGTTYRDPLLDVLVHTQDIVLPLGRIHSMPIDGAREAADYVWRRSFPFRARRRLDGFRFTATNADWSAGRGATVEGPIEAILLVLTGRSATVPLLSGPGAILINRASATPG
jgi:uncharacterized protein (TIGR03083 family)